jgi:hypothetical protein
MPESVTITGELLHTAPAKGGDITFQVGRGLASPEATLYFEIGNTDPPTQAMRFNGTGEIFVWGSRVTTDIDLASTFLDWVSTVLRVHPRGPLRINSGDGYLGGPPGEIIFRLAGGQEVLKLRADSATILGEETTDGSRVVEAVRRFLVGVLSQELRDPTDGIRGDVISFPDSLRPTVWERLNEEDTDADSKPDGHT